MVQNDKLQNEIEKLNQDTEIVSLETLITEGDDLRIPIIFDFPTKKGITKVSAIIKPLTASEWEEATNYAMRHKKGFSLKILEKGLLNDDGEPIPFDLLKKMPMGVVNEIYKRISDISGIKEDKKEQYELTKELMGF